MKTPVALDFRNTNSLWGSVLAETLFRLGLRQAVISPGSRSTPLTIALVRHPGISCTPVLDERSAAFFALGQAKEQRQPVLLVCTSGTAGANYLPAVIEAQESGVPLIVITADRPPEMRDCRSGQTIDQTKLFGSHVNFFHELAVPAATLPMLRYLRQTLAHLWARAQWPDAGPVHLNAPFRDPLPPLEDRSTRTVRRELLATDFFAHLQPPLRTAAQVELSGFPTSLRGVVVAGPCDGGMPKSEVAAVEHLARTLGWPLLADALSGLRGAADRLPMLVTQYDSILRSERAARRLRPEVVLCLGGWPTSKALRSWIEQSGAAVWMVSPRVQNLDALHAATRHVRGTVSAFASSLVSTGRPPRTYAADWQHAEAVAVRAVGKLLAKSGFFEGRTTVELAENLAEDTPLIVANSMPVRDVEYFWPASAKPLPFYFSRGANGIDGTLSTALGVAQGCGRPAVLLTGDLALLHDTNGFLLAPKFLGSLTILLINNEGGGIFGHLPVAAFDPPFEEYFATPQRVDFGQLAHAYGVAHVLVNDWAKLRRLLAELPVRGIRVLELRTDRRADAATRKALFVSVAKKLDRTFA